MDTQRIPVWDSSCSSRNPVSVSLVSLEADMTSRNSSSFMVGLAMRISRSRWYRFLRRIFHYQNGFGSGLGSHLGPNPLDSKNWMLMEFIALAVQITLIAYFVIVSMDERPARLLRIWVLGYGFVCFLSLFLLCFRYWYLYLSPEDDSSDYDIELQRSHGESRKLSCIRNLKTWLDLSFAIWFVVGNVWMMDARFSSFHHRAPKLRILCISLLAWNVLSYSFPVILFVIFCCCIPLFSKLTGYNMNMESSSLRTGATDEQLASLPSWSFNGFNAMDQDNSASINQEKQEWCCICLGKYKINEEIRKLPCGHIFHLNCVNQWLMIMASCPLCKQGI